MSEEEEENENVPEGAYDDFEQSLKDKVVEDDIPEDNTFDDKVKELQEASDGTAYSVDDLVNDDISKGSAKEVEEEKDKVEQEVPKDTTFDENPASVDSIMREVLIDTEDTEVTEGDKRNYIKAVLNDVPVRLDLSLCGANVTASIRSRTSWEQTCIYAALQADQDEGIVTDFASVIIQLQKYGCSLMLEKVNDKEFSKEKITEDMSIEDAIVKLRKLRKEKIEVLSIPKWGILLNALRLFESKLSKMGTQCLNENFWEPVG